MTTADRGDPGSKVAIRSAAFAFTMARWPKHVAFAPLLLLLPYAAEATGGVDTGCFYDTHGKALPSH